MAEVDERGLGVRARGSDTRRRALGPAGASRQAWPAPLQRRLRGHELRLRQQRQSHCLKLSKEGQVTVMAEATGKSCRGESACPQHKQ